MKLLNKLKVKHFIGILIFLLLIYGWLIFMQTVTLSTQITNHWTHIAYLSIVCILMILGLFKKQAYLYILYISLLMPLDNIFNGLRFSDFYVFYSYVLYNFVALAIAYLTFRFIKSKGFQNEKIIKRILVSLIIVLIIIGVGVYQHHLEVSWFTE